MAYTTKPQQAKTGTTRNRRAVVGLIPNLRAAAFFCGGWGCVPGSLRRLLGAPASHVGPARCGQPLRAPRLLLGRDLKAVSTVAFWKLREEAKAAEAS